jgi:hypothetical protein
VVQVNWKAAATAVTGVTALAGWLSTPSASHTASPPRAASARTQAAAANVATHAANIEEQSLRLAARLRPSGSFTVPQRNPFHFVAAKPAPPRTTIRRNTAAIASVPAAPVEPPPFPYRLSGVATDRVEGQPARTAVLAGGDTGLVLAKAGDMIEGVYRVDAVDETAVQITDTRDGRTVRLTFATP